MSTENAYTRMIKYKSQNTQNQNTKTKKTQDFKSAFFGLKNYNQLELQKEYVLLRKGDINE